MNRWRRRHSAVESRCERGGGGFGEESSVPEHVATDYLQDPQGGWRARGVRPVSCDDVSGVRDSAALGTGSRGCGPRRLPAPPRKGHTSASGRARQERKIGEDGRRRAHRRKIMGWEEPGVLAPGVASPPVA